MPSSEELIPGLPDDVGFGILARVSRSQHLQNMIQVCSSWRAAVTSTSLFEERKRLQCTEAWFYKAVFSDSDEQELVPNLTWFATAADGYEGEKSLRLPVPPMPESHKPAQGFQTAVIHNLLYVIGGFEGEVATNKVSVFNPVTNKWSSVAGMADPRVNFAAGVIDGLLYVAGGDRNSAAENLSGGWETDPDYCENLSGRKSAEVFDPANGRWSYLPEMNYSKQLAFGFEFHGKLVVSGFHSQEYLQFEEATEVYDPEKDEWQVVGIHDFSTSAELPVEELLNELCMVDRNKVLELLCEVAEESVELSWNAPNRKADYEGTLVACQMIEA